MKYIFNSINFLGNDYFENYNKISFMKTEQKHMLLFMKKLWIQ